MEVSAASVSGYTTPQDFETNLDPAGANDQQEPRQDAASAQEQESAAASTRGCSLPPDSAIHPSIATQLMQGVVNGAKETANFVQTAVRTIDEKKEQLGAAIDSGEKYLEGKVDDGRAWLRENGGAVGQAISDQIGRGEEIAIATGKGIVQLADDAASLTNPLEWATNPDANIARLKSAVNGAETAMRTIDEKKEQLGSWIDSGEKYLEGKADEGRAWLRENGGVVGQVASDYLGFEEGLLVSVYDAGKGIVQLADGAISLANPLEWAANPDANIARLKSAANGVETLGKLALLASPEGWMMDPQGNAQLAGALWNSAATSFNKDPAKFTGNVVGTVAMMAVPVGGEAAIVGDVGRGTVLMGDASRIAEGADIAANINKAKTLAEAGNLAKPEPVIAEGANAAANAAKGEQNTAKVGSAASRVFTSTDPLVGSTATAIDRALPGAVKDVNVPIKNPKISLSSDADIMLKNGDVIEVKSGGGKGATTQVANQVKIIGNSGEVIVYGPDLKPSVINGIRGSGTKVFTNLDELISYIKSKGL